MSDAVERCLAAKRTAGRRPRYVETLAIFLRAFARGRVRILVSAITVEDVERWIREQ